MRVAVGLGRDVREERSRRALALRALAGLSGLSRSVIQQVEAGRPASLDTYVRIADALCLRPEFDLIDPRRRTSTERATDPVHAAMGEAQATHFRHADFHVGMDEPFQHYQFAGRADLVAWPMDPPALLHIENRTQFPDVQATFGSFNAKRSYLGAELAARAGVGKWRSETHVVAALWSAEVLRALRAHASSFVAVCPDDPSAFEAWWRGEPPKSGRHSILVLFDPMAGRRSDRRRWAGLSEIAAQLPTIRPRYRHYADAAGGTSGRRATIPG